MKLSCGGAVNSSPVDPRELGRRCRQAPQQLWSLLHSPLESSAWLVFSICAGICRKDSILRVFCDGFARARQGISMQPWFTGRNQPTTTWRSMMRMCVWLRVAFFFAHHQNLPPEWHFLSALGLAWRQLSQARLVTAERGLEGPQCTL